ncbi:SpoIIAA-like anti-anti-sigma regulatory factor [Natranaerovirga hydrolytica]|uniref:Anti-sigma F factor antagonist n=1 Tax=Natranaerovirga hydrolytica TaxID=680378 RepID=A0A4R1MME0_9FIRM|nr:anti-sigma F factor antagonist [Natranaerovirga hydrolytica]TCK92444.1 SpoIIAA-like anti-anti-sigma regulatory factor [Natranaerovirga hydrolytica]
MQIKCEIKNRNLLVNILGELDHHNAKSIREKIDQLIARNHIKNIIFDFSNIDFMDSSGIGVIMGRYKNLSVTGGKVGVVNVKPTVDRIFNLSGLYKIILKYDNVKDALNEM